MDDQQRTGGRPIQTGLLLLAIAGGALYFFTRLEIEPPSGPADRAASATDLASVQPPPRPSETFPRRLLTSIQDRFNSPGLNPQIDRPPQPGLPEDRVASPSDRPSGSMALPPLRIGAWAMDGFGTARLSNDTARAVFLKVARQFDALVLTDLAADRRDLVPRITAMLGGDDIGRGGFDYVSAPPSTSVLSTGGGFGNGGQTAILFNRDRLAVDRSQTYVVGDPEDRLTTDPLVTWFRSVGVDPTAAFTFSLVAVQVDLTNAAEEILQLRPVFDAVAGDGRGEDDVILIGQMQADDAYLLPSVGGRTMTAAIRSRPTDIYGTHQSANLLYDAADCVEATGAGGVIDFLRLYNLSLADAESVSSQLPIFAEFFVTESYPQWGGVGDQRR